MTHKAEEKHLPATIDLSPKAVERAVVGEVWQKPYTVWPAVLGVIGVGVGAVMESALGLGVGLVLAVFGVGSGVVNHFFRHEIFAGKYFDQLHALMRTQAEHRLRTLERDLRSFKSEEGLGQLEELKRKYESFLSVLGRQFEPNERTFHQYRGTAEQVYLAVLDNLQKVVVLLDSVSEIGAASPKRRLREEVLSEVRQLLEQNEQAVHQLDVTATEVARIKTRTGYAKTDLEKARLELQQAASAVRKLDMRKLGL